MPDAGLRRPDRAPQTSVARQSAEQLACSERTVNYHLANAMAKLKVDNKLAAVQRACWIGAL